MAEFKLVADDLSCHVVNEGCLAPPNVRQLTTRCVCFACGNPACTACSKIRKWFNFGKRRVCDICWEDR